MSNTQAASGIMLLIQRRAKKRGIKKALLNILLAIDNLDSNSKKAQIEQLLDVTLNNASIKLLERMGLISHTNIGRFRNRTFVYNLTVTGEFLLERIFKGTEIK